MKYNYNFLLLAALLFLTLNTANAAKDKLTEDPKSEFNAKVNNKDWKAGFTMCNVEISSLEISGFGDNKFGISLSIDGSPREGTFEISKKSKNKASYSSIDTKYTVGANDVGKIIITKYDAAKKLFSGTFELKLTDAKTGKKVTITDGKFNNLAFYDKPKTGYEFKAKLNGAKWNWVGSTSAVAKDTANISAAGSDKRFLNIKFPKNTPPGEYVISTNGDISAYYKSFEDKNDVGLKAKTGRLIIQKNDEKEKTISGKFEIEMVDESGATKVKFTDGSFTMFYQE
jgi:hypothetical protein